MAAELGLLSLSQLQNSQEKLVVKSRVGGAWMWNSNQQVIIADQENDDSWEVRAFEEDTNNVMGTTWPPRSYTCTFCRREFRSAQALGGHMNVHRRDRALLHQKPPLPAAHHQEFVTNGGGLCLLYSLPNPNTTTAAAVFSPSTINHCIESSSSKLVTVDVSPNFLPPSSMNHTVACSVNSLGHSSNTEQYYSASISNDNCEEEESLFKSMKDSAIAMEQEIDLELRLGCGSLQ